MPESASQEWDLVVVHTIHPSEDHGWLTGRAAVLDTTHRLKEHLARHVA
jgi:hypothetical protein